MNYEIFWPAWRQVLPHGRHDSVRERIKYAIRLGHAAQWKGSLLATIARHQGLRTLYGVRPQLFHAPISAFVDRRFSVSQRFQSAGEDLECALSVFGDERIARWAQGQIDCISEPTPGIRICLSLNEINPQEGLWAISLRSDAGTRLYNLSFAFQRNDALVIASVQGPTGEDGDRREEARRLTKSAHGLRPTNLLLHALRIACGSWGTRQLLAVDPTFHVKGRWNHRHRLKFGYRDLWREMGGAQRCDGYWQLPVSCSPREMDHVPSRKRSMYRRRFEMLDGVRSDFAAHMVGSTAGLES